MNKPWIIVSFLGIIFLIVVSFFTATKQSLINNNLFPTGATPTPVLVPKTRPDQIPFKTILPGITSVSQVEQTLGSPILQQDTSTYTVLDFSSGEDARPNKIYVKNTIAQIIEEEILTDNSDYTNFRKTIASSPNITLYSPLLFPGANWFIYLPEGIAYLADAHTGYTFKKVYFQPTTQDDFLKTIAPEINAQKDMPPYDHNDGSPQ